MVAHGATSVAWLLLVCAGCAGDRLVLPESDEIVISVVLVPNAASPANQDLRAFLIRAGTPIRSPYLVADRFEMRRLSDGALFDWRPVAPEFDLPPADSTAVGGSFIIPLNGNYLLPRVGLAGRLGRQDLAAGETYTLVVEVQGRNIIGQVTIPGVPTLVRTPDLANGDSVVWRRVDGAEGYSVTTPDFYPLFGFTKDTVFQFDSRIQAGQARTGTVVRAYEPQLFAYVQNFRFTNSRVGRAGIVGGLGVFGAYNSDSLPPRGQATPQAH